MAEDFGTLVLEGNLSPELEMSGEMAFSIVDNRSIASYDKAGAVRPSKDTFTLDERDGLLDLTSDFKLGLYNVKGMFSPIIQANDICKVWDPNKVYKKGELCFYSVLEREFFPTTEKRYTTVYRAKKDNSGINPEFMADEYWEPFVDYLNEDATGKVSINGAASINGAEGNIQSITFYGDTQKIGNELVTPQGKVESVGGKNLLDMNGGLQNYRYYNGVLQSDSNWMVMYIPCKSNKSITVSGYIASSGGQIVALDSSKNILEIKSNVTNNGTYTCNNSNMAMFGVSVVKNSSLAPYSSKVQIEYGTVATEFEPYKSSTINASEISPNKPLYGIGDIKNTLEVFADGSGVYTQKVKKVSLNNITNWAGFSTTTVYGKQCKQIYTTPYALWNDHDATISNDWNVICNQVEYIKLDKNYPNLYFNEDFAPKTSAEFNTWLASHSLEMMYILATPITTPLTTKEVAEFLALKTFNNSTITADALTDIVYYKNNTSGNNAASVGTRVETNTLDIADTKSMISDEWSNTKTYTQGEYCISKNSLWKSKVNNNLGNVPTEGSYWTATSVANELDVSVDDIPYTMSSNVATVTSAYIKRYGKITRIFIDITIGANPINSWTTILQINSQRPTINIQSMVTARNATDGTSMANTYAPLNINGTFTYPFILEANKRYIMQADYIY